MLKKIKDKLILIFYLLFGLTFGYLFIGTFIHDISANYELNKLLYFFLGIIIFIVWYFIYKIINKYYDLLSKKQEFILLFATFIVFCTIILICILSLKMSPQWDYRIVYNQAVSYVTTSDRTKIDNFSLYLQYHSNNIGLFVFWVIIFSIVNFFGITDFLTTATIVNAFMVGISIFLMYLCIKKLSDNKKAYFSLIISLFFVPLFTYIPIFYTDTISLPFIMIILYLYLNTNKNKFICKRNIFIYLAIILLSFLGGKIKMTVWVITVAIFIYFLFKHKLKQNILIILVFICLFSGFSFTWNKLVIKNKSFNIVVNDYGSIPWTHYLMMGVQKKNDRIDDMRCIGGYNYKDFEQTLFYKTSEESKQYNLEEYKRRVKEYGFIGYLDYLTKKAVNAWGEGSYFTDYVYQFDYRNINYLKKEIRGINNNNNLLYFEQGVTEAMLFIFSCFGFLMFSKKKKLDKSIIIPLSIYGIFIVLLFWENRSRYLYNYILIFITLITLFYSQLSLTRKKHNKNTSKLN